MHSKIKNLHTHLHMTKLDIWYEHLSDPMFLAVALLWMQVSAFHKRQLSLKNKLFVFISRIKLL